MVRRFYPKKTPTSLLFLPLFALPRRVRASFTYKK